MNPRPIGLYIHIPFCRAKCAYCDFVSYPHLEHLHERYIAALLSELELVPRQYGRIKADTIYIGGGTPTCLAPALLVQILTSCQHAFDVTPGAEITVEANPGTVTPNTAITLRSAGVGRLSIGAQSLRDGELRLLGRIHGADEIYRTVNEARSAGIHNINLDLIYGLPHQTLEDWRFTLEETLSLAPDHLSLYALSVEEGTPLAESIEKCELPAPDTDLAADMYLAAEERLERAGCVHYELSNWATWRDSGRGREGARSVGRSKRVATCRHNLKYWRREPYLGFGAGAHSFYDGWRYNNVPHPEDFIGRLEKGHSAVENRQWIGPEEAMAETMILGLRLVEGVHFSTFQRRHQRSMRERYGTELNELGELGLLVLDRAGARLTRRGRLLANEVFGRFWPCSGCGTADSAVFEEPPS